MKYPIIFLFVIGLFPTLVLLGKRLNSAESLAHSEQQARIRSLPMPKEKFGKREFVLIGSKHKADGTINTSICEDLPEHILAMAAFYSAMGGSKCEADHCGLTTALGLGKQSSEEHKAIIKQYFPKDKVAELVVQQD